MKATLHICVTSGIKGPETELSEELSKEISDLALQLDEPWKGAILGGLGALGPDHYYVAFTNQDAVILAIRTRATGYVSIWKIDDFEWHEYKDTAGLWAKLAPSGSQAYQEWIETNRKAMEAYVKDFPNL